MMGIEYGLGRFGDVRLEKGGRCCTKPWCGDRDAVSGALAAAVRGKCSLPVFCATIL